MSGKGNTTGGQGGGGKGPCQPTRADSYNPQSAAYNPSSAHAKGGNPSADRAAAMNPQHHAYNPTSHNK
ncbi:hypothetical protein sr11562 [Sporisorium reilianum SRZ2]|uniref:Uncharacterized protein n=2 Tax=Sporisorium reilianum TaxID=72558 RepID=E6ZJV9_SPORE|nr:hypothetical protein sr11562 [Sporisorium reilianum SRZ2]SJX60248.1 uncharacterized protein SRS1_11562 [Sporisorium reilianum f. sp. reilianum]